MTHSRTRLGAETVVTVPHDLIHVRVPVADKEWLTVEYGSIAEGVRTLIAEARDENDLKGGV